MDNLAITSGIASARPADGFYNLVACAVLLLAIGVAIKAWFHDRSKGRSRCRRCWYTLPHDKLAPCPECGKKPRSTKHLYRTRRSKRWGCVSFLLGALACSVLYWPHVQYRRTILGEPTAVAIVPTTYWIWAMPYSDQQTWVTLCQRISFIPTGSRYSIFGPAHFPGSGQAITTFSPDPLHLGYPFINDTNSPDEFLHQEQQSVYRWQGRLLLDRLIVIARGDADLLRRVDAFYLYVNYNEYREIEHFTRAFPLLVGPDADAFAAANPLKPYWGSHGLDPNFVANELRTLYSDASDDVIKAFQVRYGLALTGNPAIEVALEQCASEDPATRRRGFALSDEIGSAINQSRGEENRLIRDRLDAAKAFDLVIMLAQTDDPAKSHYFLNLVEQFIWAPPPTYVQGGHIDEDYGHSEPDVFLNAFVKQLIHWFSQKITANPILAEATADLFYSFLVSVYSIPRTSDLWWELLDLADFAIVSENWDAGHASFDIYLAMIDPDADHEAGGQLSKDTLFRIRSRIEAHQKSQALDRYEYELADLVEKINLRIADITDE